MHQHEDTLTQEVIDELSKDHLELDPPERVPVPISFADDDPVSEATPLGKATLAVAEEFLKMPLREDAGVNNDKGGHIKTFFIEGLKWSTDTWDRWAEKYPKSGVAKPEWCAAFGSYCARKAYTQAGLKLPATPSGSASEMASRFTKAGRFLTREELFDAEGCVKEDVTPPGPGDLVVFHGHVGMLKTLYPSGVFVTIEGNTWTGKVRADGVYQLNRSSKEHRADGTFRLVGFCVLASKDGIVKAATEAPPPAPAEAPAAAAPPETPAPAAEPAAVAPAATPAPAEPPPAPATVAASAAAPAADQ